MAHVYDEAEEEFDIGEIVGAELVRGQKLSLYIPSRTKDERPINQRLWVENALSLLAEIGGGATATPCYEGIWIDSTTRVSVKDNPIIVYCFIDADKFTKRINDVAKFLHTMGRKAKQDAVAFEFNGDFYIIHHKNYAEMGK